MKPFPPTNGSTIRSSLVGAGAMCLAATLLTLLVSRGVAADGADKNAAPMPGTAAATVTANFSANKGVGYANVFGVCDNGPYEPDLKIMKNDLGVSFVRLDAPLGTEMIPCMSLKDWKSNAYNCQDASTWRNRSRLTAARYSQAAMCHKLGMKVMIVFAYVPKWLWYPLPPGGRKAGGGGLEPWLPSDMAIYEAMVGKMFSIFHGVVDYVEIDNEPDTHSGTSATTAVDFVGTPYTNFSAAWKDKLKASIRAIHAIDPSIPVGGPALGFCNNTSIVDSILSDPELSRDIGFFSFHGYGFGNPAAPSPFPAWQVACKRHGRDVPLFITEWGLGGNPPPACNRNDASGIPWTGWVLTNFYMDNGRGAAQYRPIRDNTGPGIMWKNGYDGYWGFNGDGTPTQKFKTWRLLGRQLGLSAGNGTVRGVSFSGVTNAGAATNSNGTNVVWFTNNTPSAITSTVTVTGLANGPCSAQIYEASAGNDATNVRQTISFDVSGGSGSITVSAPGQSVVGMKLEQIRSK